ncbi:MAG: VanZ family protein [Clostridia bacterium]|nr:VanZ family protein [Clostridia bacterium]
MILNANSTATNLAVTLLVSVMVFGLPAVDRAVCSRLGLSLQGGVSTHPKAPLLLRIRQWLLTAAFGVYLLIVAWLVFFSRRSTAQYAVHAAPFQDLVQAFRFDFGLFDIVRSFFLEGIRGGLTHIRIVKPEDIAQVYMNVMLFVPMGYLLPYIFPWFRAKVRIRPAVCCFLVSLAVENLQLLTRRGLYDLDDLLSNTVGGLIGQLLFISFAYVVTHPNWRKEARAYRRWKRNARRRTLYPFAKRIALPRTTLFATDETAVWDFYVTRLGFRPLRQLVPEDGPGTAFLLGLGRSQIEIRCSNREEQLPEQVLTLSVRRLWPVQKRLRENGIETGAARPDPYTGCRRLEFDGPDNTRIVVLGE